MASGAGQQKIQELLDQFPGPISLDPSIGKAVAVALVGIIMLAACVFLIIAGNANGEASLVLWGWIGTIFFGLGLVPILRLLLFSRACALTLNRDGFTAANGLFRWNCRWSEVSEFGTQKSGVITYVCFTNADRQAWIRKLLGFGSDWLQSIYRVNARGLVMLLSGWRERALAGGAKAKP
jgi:hypothetical protein